MKINPYLGVIIALTFGAFNGVLTKWLELDPTIITFFRMGTPALVLFLFLKLYKKTKIFRQGYQLMLLASIFNAGRMFLYFLSFTYTSVANAVIMLYTWPIFSSIFSIVFLKEKAKLKEWLLIMVAFLGVVLMVGGQELNFSNLDLVGMLIMMISAAMYAITVVIFKKRSQEYNQTETIFYQNILGALIFLPFIFIKFEGLTITKSLLAIGHYGLLVGIGSFILIFTALKKLKVIHFSLINYWEVIAGVILGIIFLGEVLTLNMLLGGLIIISSGIGLIFYKKRTDN